MVKSIKIDPINPEIRLDLGRWKRFLRLFTLLSKCRQYLFFHNQGVITNVNRRFNEEFRKPYSSIHGSIQKNDSNQALSVIIPLFYEGQDISFELKSVLHQEEPPKEIILVNDNPLVNLKSLHPKIKVISHTSTVGRGQSRNDGAKVARGNILLFKDLGISIPTDFTRKVKRFYANNHHKSVILKCNVLFNITDYLTDRHLSHFSHVSKPLRINSPTDPLDKQLMFVSDLFAIPKKQFEKAPFDERFGTRWGYEDVDFALGQVQLQDAKIVYTQDVAGSSSTNDDNDSLTMLKKFLEAGMNYRMLREKWKTKRLPRIGEDALFKKFKKEKPSQEELVKQIGKHLTLVALAEKEKEQLALIPPSFSEKQMQYKIDLLHIAKFLGYQYCLNESDCTILLERIKEAVSFLSQR